ncbi:MAG: prolyl oligopeptidase family serine peptidase [Planctomycetaceae bacterium]|nr:prolyl oligopeptidase family serine peptidase [Planctomycetaceae bacterium]
MLNARLLLVAGLLFWLSRFAHAQDTSAALPPLSERKIPSSLGASPQPLRYWGPQVRDGERRPLLVLLHTWSSDYRQDRSDWQREAVERKWFYVQPNFRGPNQHPDACGSKLARQDVLDALDWALDEFPVDRSRVYLAGVSGGGHMTMLMAGYVPERFSAASAWVGISDLRRWYEFHARSGTPGKYAQMIAKSCGGAPGMSAEVDDQYRERSPLTVMHRATELPLDLNAGVNDGHSGSVPVEHTILAFNAVAAAQELPVVSREEIDQLWGNRCLTEPQESDTLEDPLYGRELFLRRIANRARVTIFEGGHEALPHAACEWLSRQQRETAVTPPKK